MNTERSSFLFSVLQCLLLCLLSSSAGFPHNFSSAIIENDNSGPHSPTPDLSYLNRIISNGRQNFFTKSSRHPTLPKRVKKAKYFMAVVVNTQTSTITVSPRFLSVSVSPKRVAGTTCIQWDSKKLKVIAHSLSPMWLRIGGTEADYVTFIPPVSTHHLPSNLNDDDDSEQGDVSDMRDYSGYSELDRGSGYMSRYPQMAEEKNIKRSDRSLPNPNYNGSSQDPSRTFKVHCRDEEESMDENISPVAIDLMPYEWDRVQKFAKRVGWKVIFALNVQMRGFLDWDMSNAISLIGYSLRRGFKTAWELGNEPTRFRLLPNAEAISPEQLSYDFTILKNLLRSMLGAHTFIAGPDVSAPSVKYSPSNHTHNITHSEYLQRFLAEGANYGGVLDAMTWHYYYVDGHKATIRDFISYSIMDQLMEEVILIHRISGNYSLPIWLGETGDAFHGGAPGLSNSFLSGFLFIDKLGLAAALGVKVVMQHTLMGINGLLQRDLEPLPNYWIAVLHKLLVGNKVLSVQNGLLLGRRGRVYAHCTKHHIRPQTRIPNYSNGDVTLLVVNTYHSPLQLMLLQHLADKIKDVYLFTPLDYNLRSKSHISFWDRLFSETQAYGKLRSKIVTLNRVKLYLAKSGSLPQLVPLTVSRNKEVIIPGLSYGFVVIRDVQAAACMK